MSQTKAHQYNNTAAKMEWSAMEPDAGTSPPHDKHIDKLTKLAKELGARNLSVEELISLDDPESYLIPHKYATPFLILPLAETYTD